MRGGVWILLGTSLNEGLCANTIGLLSPKIYLRRRYRMFISTDTGAGRDFPHISRPALGLAQLLCNWYLVSSPGVERQRRGTAHPTPFSADVKERVQLYSYFPNRPSLPVLGWVLPFTITDSTSVCHSRSTDSTSFMKWHVVDFTYIITNLLIQLRQNSTYPNAGYADRVGPSGNTVENSTTLTCLEITGYRIKYSAVLWLLELQIRRSREV